MSNPHQPEQWQQIDPVIDLEAFTGILLRAGIPLEQYGTGGAKRVENLHKELAEGESVMYVGQHGEIKRDVNVVWVDVICTLSDGSVMCLREDRQTFKDGRTRRRSLPASLGEKLKDGEDIQLAAGRAVSEEINVAEVDKLFSTGSDTTIYTPETYPGLESTYTTSSFVAVISESAFAAVGYVENQAEKDNYYVWQQLA